MPALRKSDLLAVSVPPGPRWPALIEEAWSVGAAVLPVDHRLPAPERDALLAEARPTAVFDGSEVARVDGGVPVEPGVGLVVPTSGTAGRPRLAEIGRDAIEAAVRASAERLGALSETWLCCLPLSHVGGLLVVLRGIILGCPVAIHPRFDPDAVAGEREAAFVSLVPTMLARLLDAGCDLARFRAILVGGAELPRAIAARAAGARIVPTYGLTESCGGVVYDGLPLTGVGVRLGPGGEVLLRGPTLMRRYRLRPEESAAALSGGWLRTADAGEIAPDGRLRVLGRLDEAIVTGGEKVWPSEVEAALGEHPGVAEVAVVGRADPEWGERVVALVVPARPGAPPSLGEIRRFTGARLARHKLPSEIVVVSDLSRTAEGKLVRRAPGVSP